MCAAAHELTLLFCQSQLAFLAEHRKANTPACSLQSLMVKLKCTQQHRLDNSRPAHLSAGSAAHCLPSQSHYCCHRLALQH